MDGIGTGLMLGWLMYRSGLVSRRVALLGVIGGPLLAISGAAVLLGVIPDGSTVQHVMTVPEILWEAFLALWLPVMGFRRVRAGGADDAGVASRCQRADRRCRRRVIHPVDAPQRGARLRPGSAPARHTSRRCHMIVVDNLTKRYGKKTAVDGLTFTVQPGMVTGFLGPNGSGKSTTMRLILGLHAPTSGSATVNGTRYAAHGAPLRDVGVLLEARAVHPGRSAYDHLLAQAQTQGISRARVNELVEFVGLQDVAKQRVGQFSLGMGRRLGIASALLGDPATLILDEPINGLDPDGIHWMRGLLKTLAAEGSHRLPVVASDERDGTHR